MLDFGSPYFSSWHTPQKFWTATLRKMIRLEDHPFLIFGDPRRIEKQQKSPGTPKETPVKNAGERRWMKKTRWEVWFHSFLHFEQNSGWKLSSWKFFWSVFWQLSYQKMMDKVVGTQVVGPWLRKHPCWKKKHQSQEAWLSLGLWYRDVAIEIVDNHDDQNCPPTVGVQIPEITPHGESLVLLLLFTLSI